jgi:hypothetical protein
VIAEHDGTPVREHRAAGTIDLVAEVRDWMPMTAPNPWTGKPVMPALVRWRILGHDEGRWIVALDLRVRLPDVPYDRVYGRWTRQNKPWRAGRYRVYLARRLNTLALRDGTYTVEVVATDTAGNSGRLRAPLVIQNASRAAAAATHGR